ncbi:hypothetical protein HK098_004578 [Nowakowskiella sp. JEL0407]|nr:hypothetical protein HK098_004578 [Nowakowskiella sp. JEL0407]
MGEVLVMSVILICNIVWWVLPVYNRISNRPTNSVPHLESHALTKDRWVWDKIFGWAGWVGMWDAALAIVFVVRENFITKAMLGNEGGQYHIGLKFHIYCGFLCLFFETLHALYYLFAHVADNSIYGKDGVLMPYGYNGTWGITSYVALVIVSGFALYPIRRKNFRLFMYVHYIYVIFLMAAFFHFYMAWYPIVGAMLYLIFDRLSANLSIQRWGYIRLRQVSDVVTRVDIPRTGSTQPYAPGDWVKVQLPKVDPTQWHPFSIASSYETSPDAITLYIKKSGGWTCKLHDLAGTNKDGIRIGGRVTGIYGSKCTAYLTSPAIVFIGGGTGMAAIIPFLREYCAQNDPRKHPVYLIWVAQKRADILAFRDLLVDLCSPTSRLSSVRTRLHLTRETVVHEIIDVDVTNDPKLKYEPQHKVTIPNSAYLTNKISVRSTDSLNTFSRPLNKNITLSRTPTSRSKSSGRPSKHYPELPLKTRLLRILLCLLVFGGGLACYVLARNMLFDYDFKDCLVVSPIKLSPARHFLCFYWFPWGPITLSCAGALILGSSLTFLATAFNKQIIVSEVIEDEIVTQVPEIEALNFKNNRPDWNQLFDDLEQRMDRFGVVSVVTAGPEEMVQRVEERALKNGKFNFVRESWQT